MNKTSIEWTDKTWNPVRGCSMAPGSEAGGCLNCYAARMAARNLPGHRSPTTGKPFAILRDSGPRWTGEVELIEGKLEEPLRWRKPQRIFVNSMSDLFHEALSFVDILRVHITMMVADQHTYQVLTKRPGRAKEFYIWWDRNCSGHDQPRNLWLGVSIEDQATADMRIPLLLQTPAAIRFVSYEPALGPVDFRPWLIPRSVKEGYKKVLDQFPPDPAVPIPAHLRLRPSLDWIIAGGESGPGARPAHPDWFRSARDQCQTARVPFFMKQITERGRKIQFEEWPLDLKVRQLPYAL